jgi:hypothetical protein
MNHFVALNEKSSQRTNLFRSLRDEKNRRLVSFYCKGEVI